MDTVTHTKKVGKTHPCQHEYTSQNHNTDTITSICFSFIHQIYSTWETGLNYTNGGTSFSIEVHWEAKQLQTLEDAQVGFFCSSPKRRKFHWVFFLVFLVLIEIIVRPRAKYLYQTSRTKKWQLSALLLLDAINGFNFKYEQYIRFYLLQPCIVRIKPWRLFLKCIKHGPKWTKYLR